LFDVNCLQQFGPGPAMRSIDLWPTDLRIIEVGADSGRLAQQFISRGYRNYLAVALNERRRSAIAASHPTLHDNVTTAHSPRVVQQNNADVLILRGIKSIHMARFRSIRHAKWVALKFEPTPTFFLSLQFALLQCVLWRLAWPRIVRLGGDESVVAFRVRRPRPHQGVRRFIPHRLGVGRFLQEVESGRLRHAVLRWFEALPHVAPGEDLDLLVDDADLEAVREMLDSGPGIQPADVYSVTGLPGADFRSMPYFPPYLADELLGRAVVQRNLCRVPAPREHFVSMAYHALYHKGIDSGIPICSDRRARHSRADHDYPAVLQQLAAKLGINVTITLEDLDAYLDSQGWRPPHDMLIRLSKRNRWVRSLLRHPKKENATDDALAVFLLRQVALNRGGVERAVQLLEKQGFRVVATQSFDARAAAMVVRSVRGGNWGRGPWPISGGPPVAAIVVHDPAPVTPTRKQRKRFPFLANARLLCKEQIRDAFNEGFPADQHCNVVHSSDNGREAMDYLRIIMPESVDQLMAGAASRPARAA
jgi:hypothetical protein